MKSKKASLRTEYGLDPEAPVVLFTGKLIPKKRPADLIQAFSIVREKMRCSLALVGDGALRSGLEKYVEERKIPDVHFLGFRNQSEIGKLYALADVFVLPSSSEPWGLSVNEAMCFELPLILSDQIGAGFDLLNESNGFRYPCGNIDRLSFHLEQILQSEERRKQMGIQSREAIERWSIEAAVEGIVRAVKSTVPAQPMLPIPNSHDLNSDPDRWLAWRHSVLHAAPQRSFVGYLRGAANRFSAVSLADSSWDAARHIQPVVYEKFIGSAGNRRRFVCDLTRLAAARKSEMMIVGHVALAPLAYGLRCLGLISDYVVILHGIEAWRRLWKRERIACTRGRIVATTNFTRERFSQENGITKERVAIVPLAVGKSNLEPLRVDGHEAENNPMRVLFVGRLSSLERYKGADELIEAMVLLKEAGEAVVLNIVGTGDDRRAFERRHKTLMSRIESFFTAL